MQVTAKYYQTMKKLQSARLFTLQLLKVTRPHAPSSAKDDDR